MIPCWRPWLTCGSSRAGCPTRTTAILPGWAASRSTKLSTATLDAAQASTRLPRATSCAGRGTWELGFMVYGLGFRVEAPSRGPHDCGDGRSGDEEWGWSTGSGGSQSGRPGGRWVQQASRERAEPHFPARSKC